MRYLFGVLGGKGDFEPETLTFTPGYLQPRDRHGYTPDYGQRIRLPDRPGWSRVYHEVKGRYRLPSQDGARLRWCMAAVTHPDDVFVWAKETKSGHRWDVEVWRDGGRVCQKGRGVLGFGFAGNGGVEWRR